MKADQLKRTFAAIERDNGYMMASTFLQCSPAEGVGGPVMKPGGLAENDAVDEDVTRLQKDAGILWWLQAVKKRYGPWTAPPPAPAAGKEGTR